MFKQKFEPTWVGKGNRSKLAPRILLVGTAKLYHAEHWVADNDLFDKAEV